MSNQLPPYPEGTKFAICIPSQQFCDIRWALALPTVFGTMPPGSVLFADWRYGVAETREQLWYTAVMSQPSITHIAYIDTDMIIEPNVFPQLVADNKPIVGATYFNSLLTGVAAWKEEKPIDIKIPRESSLVEVDKIGMGACLIKKEVFTETLKDEEKPLFFYQLDVSKQKMMSEDFYFFLKLAKYGIKPYIDLRCKCQHLKNCAITIDGQIVGPAVPPSPPPTPSLPAPQMTRIKSSSTEEDEFPPGIDPLHPDIYTIKSNTGSSFKIRKSKVYPLGSVVGFIDEEFVRKPFFYPFINSDSVVIDVGAGIGAYTLTALMLGAKQVIAFEPDPRAIQIINDNIELNTDFQDRFMLIKYALFNKQQMINFGELEDVEAHTLDEFRFAPTFIKIDVEGMEWLVLQGAMKTLKEYHPKVLVENHIGPNLRLEGPIIELMTSLGYKFDYISSRDNQSFSFFY